MGRMVSVCRRLRHAFPTSLLSSPSPSEPPRRAVVYCTSAEVKSCMLTDSDWRRAARMAASLHSAASSAPEKARAAAEERKAAFYKEQAEKKAALKEAEAARVAELKAKSAAIRAAKEAAAAAK